MAAPGLVLYACTAVCREALLVKVFSGEGGGGGEGLGGGGEGEGGGGEGLGGEGGGGDGDGDGGLGNGGGGDGLGGGGEFKGVNELIQTLAPL